MSTPAKGRITAPPMTTSESSAISVVPLVRTVRGSVSFRLRFSVTSYASFRFFLRFSRTRSKTTIVSFSEYPMIVRIAATVARLISMSNSEMNPKVMSMSCTVAMTAATPNRHSKRKAR